MFKRIRKTRIEKEEIIADFIFLILSFITTDILLCIFDIHWNFYPDGSMFPPTKYIFTDRTIYLWGGLVGAIIGFFLIKIFLFGLKEEEKIWNKNKK